MKLSDVCKLASTLYIFLIKVFTCYKTTIEYIHDKHECKAIKAFITDKNDKYIDTDKKCL